MMCFLLAALLNCPGPLPVSEDGYRCVCTSVDFYTKFVDLFPLREIRQLVGFPGAYGRLSTGKFLLLVLMLG